MNYSNILYVTIISVIFTHIAQGMDENQLKQTIENTPQSKRRSVTFSPDDIRRSRISQENVMSSDKVRKIEQLCRSKNFWVSSPETDNIK